MFDKCVQSQPARFILWCMGIVLLMLAPAAATSFGEQVAAAGCTGMVSGTGQCPHGHACHGKGLKSSKTMGFVQINSKRSKEQVEDEESGPDSTENSTPTLDVAEATSSASTLLNKAVPPGGDLSSRSLVAPPGKDFSNKPSASVSFHPKVVSRGQRKYQEQALSVGAKLPLEFKRAGMLLCDHMVRRLWQWYALAANMGRQLSPAVIALVAAGVIVLLVALAVLSHVRSGTERSAKSDNPRSGRGRGSSEQGTRRSTPVNGDSPTSRQDSHRDMEEEHDTESHFCPGLIVPAGQSLTLLVPTASLSQGPFDIIAEKKPQKPEQKQKMQQPQQPQQTVVVHVEPRAHNVQPSIVPGGRDAEQTQQHRLVFTTEEGHMLAQCGPSPQARECWMLQATDDYFANITGPEENVCTLTTRTNLTLSFIRTSEDYGWNVINSSGRVLAKASKPPASGETSSVASPQSLRGSPTYTLQVAPQTDAGLVLCGLLCIQHILCIQHSM